jgi:hypothetical protein
MTKVRVAVSAAALLLTVLAPVTAAPGSASAGSGDVKVTDHPYVRHDGGTDPPTELCGTNNMIQDEPTVTINPRNPRVMTAGANDYCPVTITGGLWFGFYYSADGGRSWTNSLLPGYPMDTSVEGQESPLFGFVNNASDPSQAWDNSGHLYYGGIGFNRPFGSGGAIFVARYAWRSGAKPDYEFTTLVDGRSAPNAFDDKVLIEVDHGARSRHAGNVYACWTRFTDNFARSAVLFARSADGGRTFTSQVISGNSEANQFCDIAVTRKGDVHVAWRQLPWTNTDGTQQGNAIAWVKSTDGGRSFTPKKIMATEFTPWNQNDSTVNPGAYGQAKYAYCLVADGTRGGCNSAGPRAVALDCGDGPFACQSGYVFSRIFSQIRIAADSSNAGRDGEVYIVFDATVPGSETPTGTTYGTVTPGVGSQDAVYLMKTRDGGRHWATPTRIDPQRKGHQFFADIAAEQGKLHLVWQDSRSDKASGPPSTPSGGDFRTVPISNRWVNSNPPGGVSSGPGVETFYATSSNSGKSWRISEVSTAASMPNYEILGNRDGAFFGDYNYIAALGKTVIMAWTDNRDILPGTDPRHPIDGSDGFDIHQCRAQQPDGTYGPDTCPFDGGNDQNIYAKVFRH